MDAGTRMATPPLVVSNCIRRAPVRTLAAAATFTRRNLEFNPTVEGTTLQQQRNLGNCMLLDMDMRELKGMILCYLLPGTPL